MAARIYNGDPPIQDALDDGPFAEESIQESVRPMAVRSAAGPSEFNMNDDGRRWDQLLIFLEYG